MRFANEENADDALTVAAASIAADWPKGPALYAPFDQPCDTLGQRDVEVAGWDA